MKVVISQMQKMGSKIKKLTFLAASKTTSLVISFWAFSPVSYLED